MPDTETVLIYREEGHDTFREWVAPHSKVKMWIEGAWVAVGEFQPSDLEHYSSELLTYIALRNVVEAHLVTREKPAQPS